MSTIYVVIGTLDTYKGPVADTDTMQVFATRDAAMAYGEALLVKRADTYEIIETYVR